VIAVPELPPLPKIADEPLSVVLIARNAAEHLMTVVPAWVSFLNGLNRAYEILLVDDGSTDATARLTAELRDRHGKLRILRHEAPRGDGAALRTALATARYPLFAYTTCDPRYQPGDLKRLLKVIDTVDLVSGYRAGRPVPALWRWLGIVRRVLGRIVFGHAEPPLPGWLGWRRHLRRWFVRLVFGVRTHDVSCPFRLARRSMFARMPLQSDGAFVHVEILAKANFLGHLLGEEVPLGDRSRPVVAEDDRSEPRSRRFADVLRVLRTPTFGSAREKALTPA
jgi:glycosyltransferase involved in cell wall biosynthesis